MTRQRRLALDVPARGPRSDPTGRLPAPKNLANGLEREGKSADPAHISDDATFTFTMPAEIREAFERAQNAELWRSLFAEMGRQALEQVPDSSSIVFLTDSDLVELLAVLELEGVDVHGTACLVAAEGINVGVLQRFPDTLEDELHLCVFDHEGEYMGNQVLDRAEMAGWLTD